MMKIEGSDRLTHPAPLVFRTVRDKTPELVEHMPNVEAVQIIRRDETPPLVTLHNRWQGAQSDIPSIVRPFVKSDIAAWFDRATWNEETLSCQWEIEAAIGRDCFSCGGQTTITPNGDGCTFTLRGEMAIDPAHVPGIPRFLARKLHGPLEGFIARAISPNLTSIASAVQRYLDAAQQPQ